MNDNILRRSFVAIATSTFQGWPELDRVTDEVEAMKAWLCDDDLGDRKFKLRFKELTKDPHREQIQRRLTDGGKETSPPKVGGGFTAADALIVYVTSHGQTDDNQTHWTVLADSEPNRLQWRSLDTVSLIQLLRGHEGLDDVMIILDLCQAGNVSDSITAKLRAELANRWLVIGTSAASRESKLCAFTRAVEAVLDDLRNGSGRDASELERYLSSDTFFRLVRDKLRAMSGQDLVSIIEPYRTMACLPNPRYDSRAGDRFNVHANRSDLAILAQDMTAHWVPRSRGARSDDEAGWLFAGRDELMRRLVDFTTGPAGTLVVTGRAGSGKSAVLARLVTLSDPTFRQEHPEIVEQASLIPDEDAVDVAVLATGKSATQITQQIAVALGAMDPVTAIQADLQQLSDAIAAIGRRRDSIPTVVIDALDEAAEPAAVVQSVLRVINPRDEPRMRLIIGVRSTPEEGGMRASPLDQRPPASGGTGLSEVVIRALGGEVVEADGHEYWNDTDLAEYVANILVSRGSSYEERPQDAAQIAARIAPSAGRSFLLAAMLAHQLAEREPIDVDSPELDELVQGSIAEVFARDLVTSIDDERLQIVALALMSVAALACGRGVPWRDLWPDLANAMGDADPRVSDDDVEWLLGHRISGYLVRDLEDGVTVYRPFHDALRAALIETAGEFADAFPDDRSSAHAHGRIASYLADVLTKRVADGGAPAPYIRRHLAEHAVRAQDSELLERAINPTTLPWLDADSTSRSLGMSSAPEHSVLWGWLSAWRGVRHRWSWEKPAANAAAFDAALLASSNYVPERRRSPTAFSWEPRWTDWTWGGTIVGRDIFDARAIASGELEGRSVLAVSGYREDRTPHVQLWEASTGLPVGPPLLNRRDSGPVVMMCVDGRTLVSVADAEGVNVWDAATGELVDRVTTQGTARRLAVGEADGLVLLAGAAVEGLIWLYDVKHRVRLPDILVDGSPRGLAFASSSLGDRLIVGLAHYPDSTIVQLDLLMGLPVGPQIPISGEINAVAWAGALRHRMSNTDRDYVAAGTARGVARMFEGDTGKSVGEAIELPGEVRSVALDTSRDGPKLAAGGFEGNAAVAGGHSALEMPHPDDVLGVAFTDVDHQLMVATVCADGNTRLWDAQSPSGARRTARESVKTLSTCDDGEDILVAGGGERLVSVWRRDGAPILQQAFIRDDFNAKGTPPPISVAIGRLDDRVVVLAGTGKRCRLIDLTTAEVQAERDRGDADHSFFASPALAIAHGRAIAVFVEDQEHIVVDVVSGEELRRVPCDWYADAKLLATQERLTLLSTTPAWTRLTDVLSGEQLAGFEYPIWAGTVTVGLIGDTEALAWTNEGRLHFWDLAANEQLKASIGLEGGSGTPMLTRIAGQDLAVVGHNATVRVYDVETGRLVAELPFSTSIHAIATMAVPDDGRSVVAVGGPGIMMTELVAPTASGG